MSRRTSLRNRSFLVSAGALVLTGATLAGAPTADAGHQRTADNARGTIAHGLNSPRLLSFGPDGSLYVTEAGSGGHGKCLPGGEGDTVCFGRSASITRVRHGHQKRVLKNLPSLAAAGGGDAIGPQDVHVTRGGRYVISMGIGQDFAARLKLGAPARVMGTLVTGKFGKRHQRNYGAGRVIADVVKYEYAHNPDHSAARDSDPGGMVAFGRGFVLADAGGNSLLRAKRSGKVRALAVFRDRMVPFPPPPIAGGGVGPMQAVPTAVVKGPDGAFYVSQLTGFPFPVGAANIYRFRPGHAPTVWASGLTNVTDLAWHRGRLYAVQLADGGLLSATTGPPMGSLVRVHKGHNGTLNKVAKNLPAPYGVALRRNAAYVTTCSVCVGGGSVVKVPLG